MRTIEERVTRSKKDIVTILFGKYTSDPIERENFDQMPQMVKEEWNKVNSFF